MHKRHAETRSGGAIEFQSICKDFGNYRAVDKVSLSIASNEFFTLLGPSGCGKTTLLRMLAGFEMPSAGHIQLDGRDISALPPNKRPINTVFQNYALFPHMTVAENIGFGLKMLGRTAVEIASDVDTMLKLVRLEARANNLVTQLSGGQQQRVALARALAPKPKVLLLDEPLSALDLKLRKSMQFELKRLQAETGITFIFVTHDQEEALTMSDRIAVLSEGTVRQVGSPQDIYDRPAERFVADFIGETNFLKADVAGVQGLRADVRLSSGKLVSASFPMLSQPQGSVTVVVRPEHARLVESGSDADLRGAVRDVVYLGTDTHYHVDLEEGGVCVVRQQNTRHGAVAADIGDLVGVAFSPDVAQILKD
jgi:spermidine/putrescine transport system ATP-binding protein